MRVLSVAPGLAQCLLALIVSVPFVVGCGRREGQPSSIAERRGSEPKAARSEPPSGAARATTSAQIKPAEAQDPGAPPETATYEPFRVGADVTAPKVIKRVAPQYPDLVGEYRMGILVLECVITRRGQVRDVKILRGPENSSSKAIVAALKQWQFEPAQRHGHPVDVVYNFTVNHVPYERVLPARR